MSSDLTDTVTGLLIRLQGGHRDALDEIVPLVYDQLRAIAHLHRLGWTGDDTLGTTALVHEAYLKLAHSTGEYIDRAHFLAVAARAMRHILVDHARARRTGKRGGGAAHVAFAAVDEFVGTLPPISSHQADMVIALDESLKRLAENSERHARIIECRFFGGMTIAETARAMDISPATVKRGTTVAQAWLARELRERVPLIELDLSAVEPQ